MKEFFFLKTSKDFFQDHKSFSFVAGSDDILRISSKKGSGRTTDQREKSLATSF